MTPEQLAEYEKEKNANSSNNGNVNGNGNLSSAKSGKKKPQHVASERAVRAKTRSPRFNPNFFSSFFQQQQVPDASAAQQCSTHPIEHCHQR